MVYSRSSFYRLFVTMLTTWTALTALAIITTLTAWTTLRLYIALGLR